MHLNVIIERFYSRGQHLCKFIGTIKRKRLHKKRVQLPQDWFGTPTCPPFHCFGTPIWPPRHHVKQSIESLNKINMAFAAYLLENGLKVGGTFAHFFKPNHGVFVWTAWPKKMTNSRDGGWACLEVDIDTCINVNLDHRPTFARGAWRVFLVIGKVHQFSKITTTQQ